MRITFVGNFDVEYSSENHHKRTLISMGHQVDSLREGKATTEEIINSAINANLLVWVHTHGWSTPEVGGLLVEDVFAILKKKDIPTLTYHLDLWKGLKRERDLEEDSFYKSIGYFFTVDKLMADWFNENTRVKGRYIHAAVFDRECYQQVPSQNARKQSVLFVGSKGYHPEWEYRPKLINWLAGEYGDKFEHWGGDGLGTIRGDALNQLYADFDVTVGDSLCVGFDYPYYWSDRVYETLGRGGFLIHPYIKGMETDFVDGEHLVFYRFGDFEDLKSKIDYYLAHPDEREKIRIAGHKHVKENHTYKQRWETILREIGK